MEEGERGRGGVKNVKTYLSMVWNVSGWQWTNISGLLLFSLSKLLISWSRIELTICSNTVEASARTKEWAGNLQVSTSPSFIPTLNTMSDWYSVLNNTSPGDGADGPLDSLPGPWFSPPADATVMTVIIPWFMVLVRLPTSLPFLRDQFCDLSFDSSELAFSLSCCQNNRALVVGKFNLITQLTNDGVKFNVTTTTEKR